MKRMYTSSSARKKVPTRRPKKGSKANALRSLIVTAAAKKAAKKK